MLYQEGTVCLNRDVFSLFKLGAFFCSSISYCVKPAIDIFANRATSFDYPNVEDVFSINGRGSVATERVERGQIKKGNEVEIVGLRDVSKELDAAMAGEKAGILLRG